jgi:type II secretory pathway component GspD/PulD (secretin)
MSRLAALSLFGCLLALTPGVAQDKKERPAGPRPVGSERAVYTVQNADTLTLAELVSRQFKGEAEVSAAPTGAGGVILVRGSAASIAEVVKLLEKLDRKPRSIEVEITLAEVPAKDWKEGETKLEEVAKAASVQKIKLTAVEGHPITSTTGGSKPMVTSEAGFKGGIQRSVQYMSVGTTVKISARVGADDAVAVDLDLKDSRVKQSDGADGVGAAALENATLSTRLVVPAGKSVVAQAVRTEGKAGATVAVVVVTARVVGAGAPVKRTQR